MNISTRKIAEVCHEANRVLQSAVDLPGDVSLPWDQAPEWQTSSAVAGVLIAITEDRTPRQMHAAWSAHRIADGWVYGDKKDDVLKTHPCLVDYDSLPEGQRIKDVLFSAIVRALAPGE